MCVACGAAVWWSIDNGDVIKERVQKDILKVIKEKYSRGATGATDLIIDQIQKGKTYCCANDVIDRGFVFVARLPMLRRERTERLGRFDVQHGQHYSQNTRLRNSGQHHRAFWPVQSTSGESQVYSSPTVNA